MKGVSRTKNGSRLTWLTASCLSLAGMAGLCYLFPELTPIVPSPRPLAPRIVLSDPAHLSPADVVKLRAVGSPTLISLSSGAVIPNVTGKKMDRINPPTDAPPGPALFLSMFPLAPRDRPLMGTEALLSRKEIAGIGVSSGVIDRPVFQKERTAEATKVNIELSGGLKGKSIDLSACPLDSWTRTGIPWTITVDAEFDEEGYLARAIWVSPGPNKSLPAVLPAHSATRSVAGGRTALQTGMSDDLVRNLYRTCRIQPGERCQGSITFSFAGHPARPESTPGDVRP